MIVILTQDAFFKKWFIVVMNLLTFNLNLEITERLLSMERQPAGFDQHSGYMQNVKSLPVIKPKQYYISCLGWSGLF